MTYNEIIAGAAFLGAVLGLINLWFTFNERRVKVRLQTGRAIPVGPLPDRVRVCNAFVSVTNLSVFPIFISYVGLVRTPMVIPVWRKSTVQLSDVFTTADDLLPLEIRPRETKQIYFALFGFSEKYHGVYVETGCGEKIRHTSPGLQQILRKERVSS